MVGSEKFSRIEYEEYVPEVRSPQSGVMVTRMGVAYRYGLPVLSTLYHYPYSLVKGLFISRASLILRGKTRLSGDRPIGTVHSQWSAGYYHWITESLPRALVLKDRHPSCSILLPQYKPTFHRESLQLMGLGQAETFPGKNIVADKICLTSCPKAYGTTSPKLLKKMRALFALQQQAAPADKLVYISREKARGRRVVNEKEVRELLARAGAEIVVAEDLSFAQQVSLFARTRLLIGIHGAGLTNMVFMPEGGAVIELLPTRNGIFDLRPNTLSIRHDPCYVRLAAAMGHHYQFIENPHDVPFWKRTSLANIHVNIDRLDQAVSAALAAIHAPAVRAAC